MGRIGQFIKDAGHQCPLRVVSGPSGVYHPNDRFRVVISTDQRNILFSNYREGVLKMKQSFRL